MPPSRPLLVTFLCCSALGCAANPPSPADEAAILTGVVRLTDGYAAAGEGYFSPDMDWVIYQATPPGEPHYQMYVAPVKSVAGRIVGLGEPTRLSPPGSRNTCGAFSPDGQSLIFASTAGRNDPAEPTVGYQRDGGDYRWAFPRGMDLFRADGWRLNVAAAAPATRASTRPAARAIDLARNRLTDNAAYDAEAAFSPDGRSVVFASDRAAAGEIDLYAMDADGSNVVRLTDAPGYDGGPFLSPDGTRLVYRSDRAGNDLLQIYVADVTRDADGRIAGLAGERQLTDDANVNWGPFWHPDGEHVAYATSAHGHANYEVYVMRADGTRKRRVTFAAGFDGLPAFSPDGRYLMWTSKRSPDGTSQLFLARFAPPRDW